MAIGGGLYLAAAGAAVFGLVILSAMKPLERRLGTARRPVVLVIVFDRRRTSLSAVKAAIGPFGVAIERADVRAGEDPGKTRLEVALRRVKMRGFSICSRNCRITPAFAKCVRS